MDEGSRITMWSPGAERILGWSREEALRESGAMIFTPEDRATGAPERELARAHTTGNALDERWHVRKDGSRFWASGVTVALENGALRGFAKILRDETHRKETEAALQQSEARFRQTAEAVPDVVFATMPDGIVDYVSPRREEVTGQPPETALGTPMWSGIIHPDDRDRAEVERKAAYAGRRRRCAG